jgi:hypothetical protein
VQQEDGCCTEQPVPQAVQQVTAGVCLGGDDEGSTWACAAEKNVCMCGCGGEVDRGWIEGFCSSAIFGFWMFWLISGYIMVEACPPTPDAWRISIRPCPAHILTMHPA